MRIFDATFFDDETLGSIWGEVLGQVGAAGVGLLPQLFGGGGGSSSGQAKGLQAITAFGQQAIQTLGQILQGVQSGQLSPADGVSNAQRIVNALSDPAFVYQAQRGKDADALAAAKQQANELLSQIQALASAVPANAQGGVAASPNGPSSGGFGGVSTSTLLLLGGGLVALLLMTRR